MRKGLTPTVAAASASASSRPRGLRFRPGGGGGRNQRRSTRPAPSSLATMHTREQVRAAWRRPAPDLPARRLPHRAPGRSVPSSGSTAIDSPSIQSSTHRRGDAYEDVTSRAAREMPTRSRSRAGAPGVGGGEKEGRR